MIPRRRAPSSSCLRLSADPYRGAELPTPADFGLPSKYTAWRAWQYATVERIINDPRRFFVLCAPTGCHARGTPILTYGGDVVFAEDVELGDWLKGPDSLPRKVVALHYGRERMARITPKTGGESFEVNLGHVLHLGASCEGYSDGRMRRRPTRDISVSEYLGETKTFKHIYKLQRAEAVHFPGLIQPLDLDPYFLGIWLGDGSNGGGVSVTKADSPIRRECYRQAKKFGLHVRHSIDSVSECPTWHITGGYEAGGRVNPIMRILRSLGLGDGNLKFIPRQYQLASYEERMELLAGLLDTDGSLSGNCFDFLSKYQQLARDVAFVARSLGLCVSPVTCKKVRLKGWPEARDYWRLMISGDVDKIPTRIPRKRATPRRQIKNPLVSGFDIEILPEADYFGWSLEGGTDKLYLTADFTIHHNSGKSLTGEAVATISGLRSVLLTATKGLQDQIIQDFSEIALDIRGMSNYPCVAAAQLGLRADTTVSDAPCQMGYRCPLRFGGGCEYFDRYRRAQSAPNIVTNYQCWMYDGQKEKTAMHIHPDIYNSDSLLWSPIDDPRVPVDLLIADECDQAVEELSRFAGVEISRRESLHAGILWPDGGMDLGQWQDWSTGQHEWLIARIKTMEARVSRQNEAIGSGGCGWSKELRGLRDVERKLKALMEMCAEDEWVVDEQFADGGGGGGRGANAGAGRRGGSGGGGSGSGSGRGTSSTSSASPSAVTFSPLTPSRYAERYLWRGVRKVVLMSATVREKTAELLGIAEDEMTFVEYPSSFPVERRPIIFVPSVQMNYRTEQDDAQMMVWLARLDTILGARLDRKGVIHAVSYKRAQFIKDNSEHGRHMLIHNSRNRAEVVEQYKRTAAPCILVSPSVDTGYDFAGDLARFQIIAKLPFASTQDKVMKARQERDPNYGMFLASQVLVQMTGRSTRSEFDWSETFILDDNWRWAFRKMKEFLPDWWVQGLVWADGPTKPVVMDGNGVGIGDGGL